MSPEGDIPMDDGGGEGDVFPQPNGVIINAGEADGSDDFSDESGSDTETAGYAGYQLLSTDPENPPPVDFETFPDASGDPPVDLSSHLANLLPTTQGVQAAPAAPVSYRDSPAEKESRRLGMAADEQIRLAMAGVTLPPSNIPFWADSLDEGEWKETLLARIQEERANSEAASSEPDGDDPNG